MRHAMHHMVTRMKRLGCLTRALVDCKLLKAAIWARRSVNGGPDCSSASVLTSRVRCGHVRVRSAAPRHELQPRAPQPA